MAATSVLLLGSRALCERYAAALNVAGVSAESCDDGVAARGLWRIAKAANLLA